MMGSVSGSGGDCDFMKPAVHFGMPSRRFGIAAAAALVLAMTGIARGEPDASPSPSSPSTLGGGLRTPEQMLPFIAASGVDADPDAAAEAELDALSSLAGGFMLVPQDAAEKAGGNGGNGGDGGNWGEGRLRTWEMPAVRVEGEAASSLREEDRVGSYRQPRWTTRRRFPGTRVYVIPEGKIEVEGWARGTFERDGVTEWRFLQEIEIGLPGRFQLDLYVRQDYDTDSDDTLWGGQFEVRWALADWGVIWGNPTLYFEYLTLDQRPDKIEPKLLLGDEICERWHWAVNLVAELELSGEELEHEYAVTSGLSYTVVDDVFSIGVESVLSMVDVKEDRGDFSTTLVVGPSIQWKPLQPMTVNIAPLIGVTGGSPDAQVYVNVGWEF